MSKRWRRALTIAQYAAAGFVGAIVAEKAAAYFALTWVMTAIIMAVIIFAIVFGLERALRKLDA